MMRLAVKDCAIMISFILWADEELGTRQVIIYVIVGASVHPSQLFLFPRLCGYFLRRRAVVDVLKWTPWSEVVDDWRRQVEVWRLSGSRLVEPRSDQVDQATPISELASEGLYFAVFWVCIFFVNVCEIIIGFLHTSSKVCLLKIYKVLHFTYRIHILVKSDVCRLFVVNVVNKILKISSVSVDSVLSIS